MCAQLPSLRPRPFDDSAMASEAAQAQRNRVHSRLSRVLQDDSRSVYAKELKRYETYCAETSIEPYPIDEYKVGDFLHHRCEEQTPPNTASWPAWQSQVMRGAVLLRGQSEPSPALIKRLRDLQTAARAEFGYESIAPPEAGCTKLTTMWQALCPSPTKDLREWTIMVLGIVAYALTLRPGEFAEGAKNQRKVTSRLEHLKFFPVDEQRPHGAISLVIPEDKTARRRKVRGNKTVYAAGCGGPMCPVALMQQYMQVHSLGEAHGHQPIFAEMDASGKRKQPLEVMRQLSLNKDLAVLCVRAQVPVHTCRAMRAGRRNDLVADGSPAPIVNALGRWGSEQAAQAYARDRATGPLAHSQHPRLAFGEVK